MINKEQLIEIFKGYMDPELGIDVWTQKDTPAAAGIKGGG